MFVMCQNVNWYCMCSAGVANPGIYTASVPDAIFGYPSSGYLDDLAWGAVWLHSRTGNSAYLADGYSWFTAAQSNNSQSPQTPLAWNWDNQLPGVAVLLANFSGWQNDTIVPQVLAFPLLWIQVGMHTSSRQYGS